MKRKVITIIHRIFKIKIFEDILLGLIKTFPKFYFFIKLAPPNVLFKADDVRICNRYGVNYKLYLQDYQSWLLYFYCMNDSSYGVLDLAKKNNVIIDVGGNIGQTAMMLSKKVGENGKIFSFEPYPKTCKVFYHNLSLNTDIKNLVLENIGLGEVKGDFFMVTESLTNSGGNRINNEDSGINNQTRVEITTLDEYAKKNNILKINLIKIDVEGFELKVLKGAKQILVNQKPDLFIEIDDGNLNKQGDSAQTMINFLVSFGYKIVDSLTLKEILNYNDLQKDTRDIFCKNIL